MKTRSLSILVLSSSILLAGCGTKPTVDIQANTGDTTTTQTTTTTTTTSDVKPTPDTTATQVTTTYTLADVAAHSTEQSCWTTINGSVYDLTPFIRQHPGGAANIMKICGIDGTQAFMAQHGPQGRPERTLEGLQIGTLAK